MEKISKAKIADLFLILVAIIWGSGFIFVKVALDTGITPLVTISVRFTVASIILALVFYKKLITITKKDILYGTIIGLFLFGGFAFQTVAMQYTTPSKNAFLTSVNVVIVPFLVIIITKEKPRINSFISAGLCLCGIALITLNKSLALSYGDLLTIVCAFLFAGHIVSVGIFIKKSDPIKLSVIQMIVAAVLSISVSVIFEEFTFISDGKGIFAVVYLGVACTALCFLIQNVAQKYTSSTKASIILSTEAVFGTIFSVIIFKEALTINMIMGFIVIFIAIIIAESKVTLFKSKATKK